VESEVRIADHAGNFQVPGQAGEVVVSGPCVFSGYENDPKANGDAFFDGWFRTGDEGVLDEDGYLTLTGRIKEMINRGGEKVNPSEVDMVVMAHAGVCEAATFPIPHPTLGEEVAVAVVKDPGSTLTERDLTNLLVDKLAAFKLPRCIFFVEEIPKSDAGKVQRYRLAEALGVGIDKRPDQARKLYRIPSRTERRLRLLWRLTLQNFQIGLDDNFFLLGGDSLLAGELILSIEREFNCRLPAATLFKAGTVAEMAVLLGDLEPQGAMVPIQTKGNRTPFFCVHPRLGGVIFLYPLSKYLDADQSLYGLQPLGWDGASVPFTKAGDMATHYVAEMRKIQTHGPYFIGGYSSGGRIAIRMANILKKAGEEVAFLALFDTVSLAGRQILPLGLWLKKIGSPKGARRVNEVLRHVRFRLASAIREVRGRTLRMVLFPILEFYRRSGRPLPPAFCRPDVCNDLMRFEFRHMPSYEGGAVYFKAETGRRSMIHPDTQDSWHRIIKGKLKYIPASGIHHSMMKEPHAQSLAVKLIKELERARCKAVSKTMKTESAMGS
jgi:thioesterase domain-containing protein/acyl carrier protein